MTAGGAYDLLVLGGGPGGYVAAIRAAQKGLRTGLIEKSALGGVCLNWGCIPTKALLRSAQALRLIRRAEDFGITVSGVAADYAQAQARSRLVSAQLAGGVRGLLKKHGVDVFLDAGRLEGARTIRLQRAGTALHAEHIFLATGARPVTLPFLDYALPNVLDSQKALRLTRLPARLLIIGAGAIGMEFATIFSAYGVAVHLVEQLERVLPGEDADVSALLEKEYKKSGIAVYTGTRVINLQNDGKIVTATLQTGEKTSILESEMVLAATGVRPNSQDIGLESVGVVTDARGYVPIDDCMRTSVPGVYAIGDLTGKLALAHVASAQALIAVESLLGGQPEALNYANMPRCCYGHPEAASAGLSESEAREAGYDAASAKFPLHANGKAIAYGESEGFAKLVYDKRFHQLLGVQLCGPQATELIGGVVGWLGLEMTLEEMSKIVLPHPTVSEALGEAAHLALGEAIHI